MDLEIDLEDGLPPSKTETIVKPAKPTLIPSRFREDTRVEITSTPVGIVISIAEVRCEACGAEHKDHRGIFVENKLSNGVRQLKRISLREMAPLMALPRRIDWAPKESIPLCSECWSRPEHFDRVVKGAAPINPRLLPVVIAQEKA